MIRLLDLAHERARDALGTGAPVYVLVNPVEYHGPHLPLHNDRLVSTALARGLHERLSARHPSWPFLLADDLEVGVDPCPGPGTRHTTMPAACGVIREACRALVELGAQRVVFMTFHGSPLHGAALEEGVRALRELGVPALSPFNVVLRTLTEVGDVSRFAPAVAHLSAPQAREVLDALPLDFHAGFFETSMALWAAPDSVSPVHKALPPCPKITPKSSIALAAGVARRAGASDVARDLGFAAIGMGWNDLRPFPGYTGQPALATREAGEFFARVILDAYEGIAEDVLLGRAPSPPPIMPWLAPATLGGRLPAGPRPGVEDVLLDPAGAHARS